MSEILDEDQIVEAGMSGGAFVLAAAFFAVACSFFASHELPKAGMAVVTGIGLGRFSQISLREAWEHSKFKAASNFFTGMTLASALGIAIYYRLHP
jgi:hypothetical protein